MRLEIRRRGVKATEELRIHVKERLRLSLGRFARHIGLVRMYLRDVNDRRGGLGKKCRIVVELPPRGRVVVTGANKDISAAIAGTVTRAGFAVKRHVKRRRESRRAVINGFVARTPPRIKPRSPSIRDGRGRADSLVMPGAVASL